MDDLPCPRCSAPLTLKSVMTIARVFMCYACRTGPWVQNLPDTAPIPIADALPELEADLRSDY